MSKTVAIAIVIVVALLAFLIYTSMHTAKYRVEVCVAFNGQTSCRTASAETETHAVQTAQTNACALIASGVTETMACGRVTPTSVKWLQTK